MRLKRLETKEFCQHADLSVDLPVGLIGIVGPNGCGKSNLVAAARFSVLGDSGNSGSKADDLNWDQGTTSKGGLVKLAFEHAGEDGVVSRSITTARASMKHAGIDVSGANAVNEAMLGIAGLPKKTIQDVIFVLQGDMEKILFESEAERKKRFHGLFGIGNTETLRTTLLKELADIGEPPSDDKLKELQAKLDTDIDPKLRDMHAQLAVCDKSILAIGADVDTLNAVVAAYDARKLAEAKFRTLEQRIQLLGIEQTKLAAQTEGTEDAHRYLTELIAQYGELESLRNKLAEVNSQIRMANLLQQSEAEKAKYEAVIAVPAPETPPVNESIAGIEATYHEVKDELVPKRLFVNTFRGATGPTACPTCGVILADAVARVKTLTDQISKTEQLLSELKTAIQADADQRQQQERLFAEWERNRRNAEEQLRRIRDQLESIGTVGDVTSEESAAIEAKIAALHEADVALRTAEASAKRWELQKARVTGQYDEAHAQLQALQAELANYVDIDEGSATAAKAAIAQLNSINTNRANVAGQISQLQVSRADVVGEIDHLKQQISQSANLSTYRQHCERARTLLHHDCLPMMVTRMYLANLNAKLNEYLLTFNVPFTCTIKNDLSVMCVMGGGVERPSSRLSGGQKVVLSICFRFAIYSLFASSFGFMVLDEPTAYLDGDRIASVVQLLDQIRQYTHSTGMQLLVVTHEPDLIPAFDATIRLGN